MTLMFITIVEGGFVDIFYNATFIIVIGLALLLELVAESS